MTMFLVFPLLALLLQPACTSHRDNPRPGPDDSTTSDDSTPPVGNDSSASDDSSTTSGEIEWTLVDSTNGPISHEWAVCYRDAETPCDTKNPGLCCSVEVGIATSQVELTTFYAESLTGVDHVPSIDFSSYSVVWSYLFCCASHDSWLAVDDVTRVGRTIALTMHVENFKLGPSALGRPWVVVQVPSGDYDGVVHNLYEK